MYLYLCRSLFAFVPSLSVHNGSPSLRGSPFRARTGAFPAAPSCTPAPSRTSGPHTPFHVRRELSLAQASGGSTRKSGRRWRRRAGRAWGRRKELEFPLFLNEGEESARDSAVVATKEATAPRVCCSLLPTFLPLGWGRGTGLGPLES